MKPKSVKREEADKRNAIYNSLSVHQKLEALNLKYGKNVGAAKQRRLLEAQLKKETS